MYVRSFHMFHLAFDFDYGFLWDAFFAGASAQPVAESVTVR